MKNMKKVIRLTENDLNRIVRRVIKEQSTMSSSFQSGQKTGQAQAQATKQVVGQAAQATKQAVGQAAQEVMKVGKQTIFTIGRVTFTVIIYGASVVWLIGKGVYKLTKEVSDALIKLLTSTGKVVVGKVTYLTEQTTNSLKSAGIAIDKGSQYVTQQLTNLKDSSVQIAQWVIGQGKQLGDKVYASVLLGASKIKSLSDILGNWLGGQWETIQNQIGQSWSQAKSTASKAYQGAKSAVQNVGSKIGQTASGIAQGASQVAGNVSGFLGGLMREMFERFLSFEGYSTIDILFESRKFNNKSIIL